MNAVIDKQELKGISWSFTKILNPCGRQDHTPNSIWKFNIQKYFVERAWFVSDTAGIVGYI